MTRTLIITLTFFICLSARADYNPILLPELISKSDLIVQGVIEQVSDTTFTVKITDVLKGTLTERSIVIWQFKNWACANRFAKYKSGQEEIYFLWNGKKSIYGIMGAGNEGELPVLGKKIYYKQLYLAIDKDNKEYKVYHGIINGYEYDLTDFKESIKYYLDNGKKTEELVIADKNYNLKENKNKVLVRIVDELKDKNNTDE